MFHRVLIAVDPGVYAGGGLKLGDGVDIMGVGASPSDVKITGGSGWVTELFGSVYMSNLTIQGTEGSNYCFHGSETTDTRDFVATFDRVHFQQDSSVAKGITGWDMSPGLRATFISCRWESSTGKVMVHHDMPGSDVQVAYIDCEADVPFHLSAYAMSQRWVKGCRTLDGSPRPDVTEINMGGEIPFTGEPPTYPGATSEAERAHYLPTTVGQAGQIATSPGGTQVTVVPGRMYYLPLPAPAAAVMLDRFTVSISSGAGMIGQTIYYRALPNESSAGSWLSYTSALSPVSTELILPRDVFVPSDMGSWWVGVRFTEAVTLDGTTGQAGSFYRDGVADATGTPTSVGALASAEGMPVPRVVITTR